MTTPQSATNETYRLRQLMTRAGVSSFRELSCRAGVSQWQIRQVRSGQLSKLRWGILCQVSQALELSPSEFISALEGKQHQSATEPVISRQSGDGESLKREYQRLQAQLNEQAIHLRQEFQHESLERMESFLRFWYTAAAMVRQNPQVPAQNLLPLLRPIDMLLEDWGVVPLAEVQDIVPYNPQQHQLKQGTAQVGDRVRVTHRGYYHGDRLLMRAQVEPLNDSP